VARQGSDRPEVAFRSCRRGPRRWNRSFREDGPRRLIITPSLQSSPRAATNGNTEPSLILTPVCPIARPVRRCRSSVRRCTWLRRIRLVERRMWSGPRSERAPGADLHALASMMRSGWMPPSLIGPHPPMGGGAKLAVFRPDGLRRTPRPRTPVSSAPAPEGSCTRPRSMGPHRASASSAV